MLCPPFIRSLGFPIHRPFHITVKGRPIFTDSIASPHMLTIIIDLIMEIVENRNIKPCSFIYSVHPLLKSRPMSIVDGCCSPVCQKQISVDHFVEEGFFELIVRS